MPQTVKLTSKRQATFPVRLCRDMGVSAGDELILERKKIDGEIGWVIRPVKKPESKWFAGLRPYAADKNHDMASIRTSIGQKLATSKQ